MELKKLDMPLSVIQVDNLSDIDLSVTPLFLGKTEDELSVVLPTKNVPSITVQREDDWRGFKIEGVLDFSLVGILAKIVSLLAAATISIFAISTYNTDYILVKRHDFDAAADILKQNGYQVAQLYDTWIARVAIQKKSTHLPYRCVFSECDVHKKVENQTPKSTGI